MLRARSFRWRTYSAWRRRQREAGAALLAAPVVDTVKRLRSDGSVETTVPRDRLARALTPQAFRAGVLRRAWEAVGEAEWSDEAALVERVGGRVMAVAGDPRNVKVTHPEDLETVSGVLPGRVRVGQGVDVHPFAPGRALWLCGVELPGETGLAGHSDADVALHAVTDAILGACGAGDIGEHFPPSDERWRNAPSEVFLRHAAGAGRDARLAGGLLRRHAARGGAPDSPAPPGYAGAAGAAPRPGSGPGQRQGHDLRGHGLRWTGRGHRGALGRDP